jgi:uncharacterized membrane protein
MLAGAAVAWAVAVPATPVLAAAAPFGAALLYAVGALICHQQPERSFHADGHQWLVCARCSGLYLGAAVGALAAWLYQRRRPEVIWRRGTVVRTLTLSALPTAATVVSAWMGLGDPSNLWRAGLAAPLGLLAGAVAVALVGDRVK